MQQEADQSFAGPGGLSGRTRVGPYDSALRAVRRLVPAMGQGRPLPLVPNGRFPCAGQADRSGKRDVAAGSAAPGAEKAHSAGKRFFGRIHTVLRGIGAVSERYVTLNLKRYRAFFP